MHFLPKEHPVGCLITITDQFLLTGLRLQSEIDGFSHGLKTVPWTVLLTAFQILFSISAKKEHPAGCSFLAEMEGFEPPHAFRRLADFESAPFSHLGTSPYRNADIIPASAQKIKVNPAFSPCPAKVAFSP